MLKNLRFFPRVLALCLLGVWLLSCSSKSSSTAPTSAGGAELNGNLASTSGQYAHTFGAAGTFNYRCTIHPTCSSLAGTIVVVALGGTIQNRVLNITQSGGTSGPYGSTCSSLSLLRDTVFVGDQVTWTNNSPFAHTVTSQ
jgi:hypothetical protein